MGRVVIIGPETNITSKSLALDTVAYVTSCEESASLQSQFLGVPCHAAASHVRMSEQSVRIPATRRAVQEIGVALYTVLPREFLATTNWTALREVPAELATAVVLAIAYRSSLVTWYGRRSTSPLQLPETFEECLRRREVSVRFAR